MERRLRRHVEYNGFGAVSFFGCDFGFAFDVAAGIGGCDLGAGLFGTFAINGPTCHEQLDPPAELVLRRPELRVELRAGLRLELRTEAAEGTGIARNIAVTTEGIADELARRAGAHKGS